MIRSVRASSGFQASLSPQSQQGWLELENVDLQAQECFRKRSGDEGLPNTVVGGGSLPSTVHAAWHRDDERCVVGGDGTLYGFDNCRDSWRECGAWTPARLRERLMVSQEFGLTQRQGQTLDGCTLLTGSTAPDESDTGLRYAVIDEDGAVIAGPGEVPGTGTANPEFMKVCKADTFILVVYQDGTSLYTAAWTPAAPTTFSFTLRDTTLSVNPIWDVRRRAGADRVVLAWVDATGDIHIADIDSTNAIVPGTDLSFTPTNAVSNIFQGLSVSPLNASDSRVAWFSGTNIVEYAPLSSVSEQTVAFSDTPFKISVESARIAASITTGGGTPDLRTEYYTVGVGLTLARTLQRSVGYSHIWQQGNQYLMAVVYDEDNRTAFTDHAYCSYFVLDIDTGEMVARAFSGEADSAQFFSLTKMLITVDRNGSETALAVAASSPKTISAAGVSHEEWNIAVGMMVMDFSARPQRPAIFDGVAHAAHAGYVRAYDGRSCYEHDWHIPRPDIGASAATMTGTGGKTASATYTFAITFESQDSTGNLARSAPVTGSVTLGAGDDAFTVVVRPLFLTERPNVRIIGWSSNAGRSSPLRREVDVANNTSVLSITLTFDAADANNADKEQLDQAAPENIRPHTTTPSTDFCAVAAGRLWTRDPRRGWLARFSLPSRPGFALGWNPLQGLETGDQSDATAVASQDGQIFVLTATENAWMTVGQGPAANGGGTQFPPLERVPLEVGVTSQAAVVETAEGIVYGSERGPRILARTRAGVDFAKMVERLYLEDGQEVVCLAYRRETAELYLGDDGDAGATARRTLRYHTTTGRWSTDSGRQVHDMSVSRSGELMMLLTSGSVVVVDASKFTDGANANYTMVMRTPWVRSTDGTLMPQFDVNEFQFLGKFRSAHTVTVSFYRDYSETPIILQNGNTSYVITPTGTEPDGLAVYNFGQQIGIGCKAISARIVITGAGRCADITDVEFQIEPSGAALATLDASQYAGT